MGDKAISESRERVRAAFSGLGLALPARRIIANLAPADLPKEGSHYDLPIALAIMAGMGVIPPDALDDWAAVGELSLDGRITAGGRRPARRRGGRRHGAGPDLPGGLRAGGGLGRRDAHPGRALADRAGQPLPRDPDPVAARARARCARPSARPTCAR